MTYDECHKNCHCVPGFDFGCIGGCHRLPGEDSDPIVPMES